MGALEIRPFDGKLQWIKDFFGDTYEQLFVRKDRGRKVGVVPEGGHAAVRMRGITFVIENYRERGGHIHGAKVMGDDVTIELDRSRRTNAIDLNIFRFIPKGEPGAEVGRAKKRPRRSNG